jgi:hypothetical protein
MAEASKRSRSAGRSIGRTILLPYELYLELRPLFVGMQSDAIILNESEPELQ